MNTDKYEGRTAREWHHILMEHLEEKKQLREEIDTIKSSPQHKYRFSPTAFGAGIESRIMITEWDEYEDDESVADLKELTEDEYYRFCADCGEEDGFWIDEDTQMYHEDMLRCYIKANVTYLKAEGGVEGLRQRFKESDEE